MKKTFTKSVMLCLAFYITLWNSNSMNFPQFLTERSSTEDSLYAQKKTLELCNDNSYPKTSKSIVILRASPLCDYDQNENSYMEDDPVEDQSKNKDSSEIQQKKADNFPEDQEKIVDSDLDDLEKTESSLSNPD